MAEKKKDKGEEDPRLEFIISYLLKSLRLKSDKWQKLMGTEDNKVIVLDWLNNVDMKTLVITKNNSGDLIPMHNFPAAPRGKFCYFVRRIPAEITKESVRQILLIGDMSPRPIDDLSTLVDEFMLPVLSNPLNQEGWPDVVKKDVEYHIQEFRNIIAEVKGNISNQTILPMPTTIHRVMETESEILQGNLSICDLKMKNSLEGIVIKWASQINDVLQENSNIIFKDNHPVPSAEIDFWNLRLKNLENIYNQLIDNRIKAVAKILEAINSVYFAAFRTSFKNIVGALCEARDITLYINPLIKHVEVFQSNDFLDSKQFLSPYLHCICLVWANSRYYCVNSKMVSIFIESCNMFIEESAKSLDMPALFQGEPDEGLVKLEKCIDILESFKSQYEDYRNNLKSYVMSNTDPIYWTFKAKTIFERFDRYIKRVNEIRNIFITANDFMKLEKIEIGGVMGRGISRNIKQIFEDFQTIYNDWTNIVFDPLDPDPKLHDFHKEARRFKSKTDILERKLSSLFAQSFDECGNVDQLIKLVMMAGNLLFRPLILINVEDKFKKIIEFFDEDLDLVRDAFNNGIRSFEVSGLKGLPIDTGFPEVAGSLIWIHKLRYRVQRPFNDLVYLDYPILKCEEGEYTSGKMNELMNLLNNFEKRIFDDWIKDIPNKINTNMNRYLLNRLSNNLIEINFHNELVSLLREAHLLKSYKIDNFPKQLTEFFDLKENLWKARVMLSRIVEWYNDIREKSEPCEYKLVEKQIKEIDDELVEGVSKSKWKNYDQDYINKIYDIIKNLHTRMLATKDNIRLIQKNIESWGAVPLYERKDGNLGLLNVTGRIDKVNKRHLECIETKELIRFVMEDNFRLFFNWKLQVKKKMIKSSRSSMRSSSLTTASLTPSKLSTPSMTRDESTISEEVPIKTPEMLALFRPYEEYIDGIVSEEILKAINLSMKYIVFEMENRLEHNTPLFEVKLELQEPSIIFVPSLDESHNSSFIKLIDEIIMDIYMMSDLIPRVAQPPENERTSEDGQVFEATYEQTLANDSSIEKWKSTMIINVRRTLRKAVDFMKKYQVYSYIWLDDKEEVLKMFLKYGRSLTEEEMETIGSEDCQIIEEYPTLDKFRNQIDTFNELYEEIDKIQTSETFNDWLIIDMRNFKHNLLNQVCKWSNLFKQYLLDQVVNRLQELEDFIIEGTRVLQFEVTKEDFDTLLSVMSILSKVKDRSIETDRMFEPLKDSVDLLKQYNVDFDENIYNQFAELPENWLKMKKTSLHVRQKVAPIQAYQVDQISRRIALFDLRTKIYRQNFQKLPIFTYPCSKVYDISDQVQMELNEMQVQIKSLNNSAELFELNLPDEEMIEQCVKESKMIKQLWDFVSVVDSCIEDWKKTPWKEIDVEDMEQECKKFNKDIRILNKDIRNWNPYIYLEAALKNLVTSLKAITELQNPSIKERHWIELMQATKVRFKMDNSTTLADLLDLNLHKYEEDVKNIVDKAVKETMMEKTLKDLDFTWGSFVFEYDYHERSDLNLLRASEELIETLEENQVQLQNLLGSKFIGFFLNEVTQWQIKLSNTDQVIGIWFEVQRKWMYLESIFIGSEDIRSQLPEDSRRFDVIDRDFRATLAELSVDPNVVKATNRPGLYEKLEVIQSLLILCEKALNDYLETKRLAFPRFYFVSSADLLDILSNGNNPELVGRHLTKLYDSIAKLKYPSRSKIATGMVSKEHDEYVEFLNKCDCSGKVEVWLNQLTDSMRETLHDLFNRCVIAYEHKPREVWLFDWPAQTALCGTQIWWTSDVNVAFGKLEEGYENALKDYTKKQVNQLNALITLLLGDLNSGDRQKIMTICTIDVHSRDVVTKLIVQKIESGLAFQWQSQLRHRWDTEMSDCFANICDAQFRYDYEYLGNTPRLVITPLTDRCYITLTQSLHLVMGGAPAGPAGTGKTETTKDLGRALGIMVYVFNCSEQMDYRSCGNIYKGLSQTGAWGCFDEFNRISVEVLSVVAVQVKSIQDAIKSKKVIFNFMGESISLVPTIGLFITMNPGYAGRTELPENLKALFRPCAMVVPDFALICEIMLVAEGFQEARLLARKFITLYTLCKELLSQQDHYDWGLRAIKSVLVVAGSLKRGDRQRPEDQVLMRALRDFNIPKIVTDDVPVFMGLIGDLFPALDVPRKRSMDFEKLIKKSATELKLQPEDGYILKIVQLEELFAVRHSVFIVGNAGTGKSQIWRGLFRTYQNQKKKPYFNDLNPKAVTNDELFGIINPATREWKDGLFSVLMRDQANMTTTGPKWLVLDGDIDPMWIESLNTVMDDNKVLTLASNERIALTKEMRLLFEIGDLKTATPATVSRAGILYINPQDLGWYPSVASWVETRSSQTEKTALLILFDKYIPILLENIKKFKRITPISDIAMIQMTCHLLDCLLTPQNVPHECPKDWYEIYFVFAVIWGFGSALFQDQLVDWRVEFNKWWLGEFKSVRFPTTGTVFNYFIDPQTKEFLPWTELVAPYELDVDIPLQATLVPTAETTRLKYFMDMLIQKKHPVMLVGGAGSGKSVIVADKLNNLSDNYAVTNVPFNFYTTSEMLQKVLEKPLEKKAGRNYGPPGSKSMIYFIDDMNMPEVDSYGTVQPHTIIRQFLDYQHWYDRTKLSLKDIHNCQFASCMNPTAGSFVIDTRLQRHFCTFAVSFPSGDPLFQIYNSILSQHLSNPLNKFPNQVQKICSTLVNTALQLHARVGQMFLPTAVKFHYVFNLRDLANIFQGLLFSNYETCPDFNSLIRLWVHEAGRVYGDKLIDAKDIDNFKKLIVEVCKKEIEDMNEVKIFSEPLIYCHFAEGLTDPKYMPVKAWDALSKLLQEAQVNYNESVGALNLVLFEDAMSHICRISRIIEGPRGNALLIGVGGSGKQSLARLAAFISSLTVTQIQLRRGYGLMDLKADLALLYMKVGVKNVASMFLMTDAQVAEESFLVLINDMLASGEISDLFPDEDIDNITNAVKNEVKQLGIMDTKENCWKYFIDKVRRMLKTVLCFSPVGSTLRVRARKFPAIVNCTAIDWFHEWPKNALESVSRQFLADVETLPMELTNSVAIFMAYVHGTVNEMSKLYMLNEKRYNYTTPKSFLELISLYSKLLNEKTCDLKDKIIRLENGILKLAECAKQVDSLQDQLVVQEVELKVKNEAADKLIVVVGAENEKVQKEKNIAADEERKVRIIEENVSGQAKLCEEDLRKAEPALLAAQSALDTLDKTNLTELKSFGSPPEAVVMVCQAVIILFSPKGKIPKDKSWKAAKLMMNKVDQFLNNLKTYDKEHIPPNVIQELQPYLKDPDFDPEKIMSKSGAAAGLCAWVINIHKFYEVFLVVEPKQRALRMAQEELQAAQEKLTFLNDKINALEEQLKIIQDEFDAALDEKQICQALADKTAFTIDLAHRLVNGLASENVRWREAVETYKKQITKLPGDVLLISCFISYVGCFTRLYRVKLQEKMWIPTFQNIKPMIPHTAGVDPLELICDDAQIAEWNNDGLPSDRMSTENATILTNSARWPLMIDPQLQGIKWIKQKYGHALIVIRLTMKGYLDMIERALSNGDVVLIENIDETVDAVLDPLLGRALIKKGRYIKIGDKEMDYNPKFRLILQTKLGNPHYKPEMQAQTTLINFTVTRDGLEEQLLAEVVKAERPDLEQLKTELTTQQNSFKINLKILEDDLLHRLSSAGENVLEDPTLVINLEKTKKTAEEIEVKVKEAKVTSAQIDIARENYRIAAERASLLYFILNDLYKINPIYQFSLKAFIVVFKTAITKTKEAEKVKERVENLIESISFSVFMYTSRALFEKDKLIFMAQMAIQILQQTKEYQPTELDFLLRFPYTPNLTSPFDFLSNICWGGIKSLSNMDEFKNLDKDIESSFKRWRKFVESEAPEREKFPGEWKTKTALQRLCMMRSLRPDRMTYAVRCFVEEKLGAKYVEARTIEFSKSFEESSSSTPIFFILSPGVDPLVDVEKVGKKLKFSTDYNNFYNVSLGQGQEVVAEAAIDVACKEGHWVILQNIHLVAKWLPALEKKMESTVEEAHENYRLFISAEPASSAEYHIIPQGILESAIKITNEPPTGMLANVHKALDNFNQETLEMCSKEAEFKAILFSLCYFHAVVAERRKFGPQGWNRVYPFNNGDLTISVYVLYNYLEGNSKVPWEDLRYLFGEIMYGGHITDDWDRRLCRTYLEEYMAPDLVDGDLFFCPGFVAPPNTDYEGYHDYIDEYLPSESPVLYGLHSNAEIGFLTTLSEQLFKTIFELQPRESGSSSGTSMSREETIKILIEDIRDKIPEEFNMVEVMARVEDRTPFVIVAFQECERMNILIREIRRSLKELSLGLKGELTITSDMESLEESLFFDDVPGNWTKLAYPSLLGLQSWFADLMLRVKELEAWSTDFNLPPSVWLAGFFNPQSFLTAIMQQTARKNEWPLDKMCLSCDVTKKQKEDFTTPPREGAFVNGLFMDGARWDMDLGSIGPSRLKELFPMMPVIFIKAITQDKQDVKNIYECPVYKTRMRGPTFVWTFNLKSKQRQAMWILGGVCLLLQV